MIEADAKRPSMKEGGVSKVDPDATFTKKHGKTCFGYNMHIGVDLGSGLICGDEAAVYGGKAYGSQSASGKAGGDQGCGPADVQGGAPLRNWQVWFNKAVAGTRSQVEQVFGISNAPGACRGLATAGEVPISSSWQKPGICAAA